MIPLTLKILPVWVMYGDTRVTFKVSKGCLVLGDHSSFWCSLFWKLPAFTIPSLAINLR